MPMPPDEWYDQINGLDTSLCNLCGGLGYVNARLVDRSERLVPCPNPDCVRGQHTRAEYATRMALDCEIPTRFRNASIADFARLSPDQQNGRESAVEAIKTFIAHPTFNVGNGNWLVLYGRFGVGKTHMAVAAINHIARTRGVTCKYIRMDDLMNRIRDSYKQDDGQDSALTIAAQYKTTQVLLLDEFTSTAKSSDHTVGILENILRYRYGEMLPTLFTTNHTDVQLDAQFGARISTLMFTANWVECGGSVLRAQGDVR